MTLEESDAVKRYWEQKRRELYEAMGEPLPPDPTPAQEARMQAEHDAIAATGDEEALNAWIGGVEPGPEEPLTPEEAERVVAHWKARAAELKRRT